MTDVDTPTGLTLERLLPAPPERVWAALTEPGALAAWFWPARMGTVASAEPRQGGRYRIDATAAGMAVSGEYLTVEPPALLVFTWRWDGEPDETVVTIALSPQEGGTRLRLRHDRFGDPEHADRHRTGWTDCLDRLPGWLAAGAGGTPDGTTGT